MTKAAYDHGNAQWKAAGVALWGGPRLSETQCQRIMCALFAEIARQFPRHERQGWFVRASGDTGHLVRPVWQREGITRLVHDISHRAHRWLHPEKRPHASEHAALERHLIGFAIARGYHKVTVSAPRPPRPKPSIVNKRAAAARANLAKAETRLKRAQTLAKKWRAKVAYYEGKKSLHQELQSES